MTEVEPLRLYSTSQPWFEVFQRIPTALNNTIINTPHIGIPKNNQKPVNNQWRPWIIEKTKINNTKASIPINISIIYAFKII